MGRKYCARCGRRLDPGAVGCAGCEETEYEAEEGDDSPGFLLTLLGEYLPGLFSVKVLICAIVCFVVALGLLGMTVFFAMLGALFVTLMAGAIALIVYASAISWILSGQVSLLTDSLMELDGRRWLLFFGLVFGPIIAVCVWVSATAGGG